MKRYAFSLFFLVALTLGLSVSVWAGSKILDFGPDTCTTVNCNSTTTNGTYTHDQNSNADPFTIQVFTAGGECVRIAVTSQGTDLEATLTCPSGITWQDDDSGGSLRPLIKAITPSGVRGWCTLTFSHFGGEGVNADFTFRYGRYNSSNSGNCSSPTPVDIFGAFQEDSEKGGDGVAGPQRGGGTAD